MPHTKTKSDNDDSHARSAKAQKAEEVQKAGTAKAGAKAWRRGTPKRRTVLGLSPRSVSGKAV